MEPKFKTSFIPKKTLAEPQRKKKRSSFSFAMMISLIIFFGAVLAAAGAFLYGEYLASNIEQKREQLDRARAAFEPALIQELTRLDSRINAAEVILDQHIAPSLLFEFFEENTLENVRFNGLLLSGGTDDTFNIVMSGTARSFNALALQSDIFGENTDVLRGLVFSGLTLDPFGNVQFSMSAFVNKAALSYEELDEAPIRTVEQQIESQIEL